MRQCEEIVWRPTESLQKDSYAAKLETRMGASSPQELWEKSVADVAKFWDTVLDDMGVEWFEQYNKTVDASKGIADARWFLGGKVNVAHNCVVRRAKDNHNALLWESENGETRHITYQELADLVGRAAAALRALNVERGDTVGIFMPMVPETAIALFACFFVGAVAVPIPPTLSADAVASRLLDAKVKVLFTADVAIRRSVVTDLKAVADEATRSMPDVQRIVFRRGLRPCSWDGARDHAWHELILGQAPLNAAEAMDAEAPCLLVYPPGNESKPKAAVHTHAGLLATAGKDLRYSFNVDTSSRFFWCGDLGSSMAAWHLVGVALHGGLSILAEGAVDFPKATRLWEMVARHKITHLGASPGLLRQIRRAGEELVTKQDLSSLQILGAGGEPWDVATWRWFFEKVGRRRCPVITVLCGREILGAYWAGLPTQALKPCSLGETPAIGVDALLYDDAGKAVSEGTGSLVCKQPIPSMTKGYWHDRKRYAEAHLARFPGIWFAGEWGYVDADGHRFVLGHGDDTIKIAGKRFGATECEAALLEDPLLAEAAAVAVPGPQQAVGCVAFVVLQRGGFATKDLARKLGDRVSAVLGKNFVLREVRFSDALPKTVFGETARPLLRQLAQGEEDLDLSSVENVDAIEAVRKAIIF